MKSVGNRPHSTVLGALVAVLATIWGSRAMAECSRDADCKGYRICDRGMCVSPAAVPVQPSGATTHVGEPGDIPNQERSNAPQLGPIAPPMGPQSAPAIQPTVPQVPSTSPAASSGLVAEPGIAPPSAPIPPLAQTGTPTLPAEAVVNTPAQTNTGSSGLRTAGIVCGAVGVASIVTAVVFYLHARSLSDSVSHAASFNPSDNDSGKQAETLQWVFYSVGGAAVGTGLLLYLLGRSSPSANAYATFQASPAVFPGGGGVSAGGTF
jgi:hypothetical protein